MKIQWNNLILSYIYEQDILLWVKNDQGKFAERGLQAPEEAHL